MQLMPGNLASYGVSDPFNIEQNIDAGTRHIKGNLTKYGNDTNMALAAYNYGPGNMASRGITSSSDFYKLPSETKNYLQKLIIYCKNLSTPCDKIYRGFNLSFKSFRIK